MDAKTRASVDRAEAALSEQTALIRAATRALLLLLLLLLLLRVWSLS